MNVEIYSVTAYRWGDREMHSYIVGLFSKKYAALKSAEFEEEYRGGKYLCEVREHKVINKYDEKFLEENSLDGKAIKELPQVNVLDRT